MVNGSAFKDGMEWADPDLRTKFRRALAHAAVDQLKCVPIDQREKLMRTLNDECSLYNPYTAHIIEAELKKATSAKVAKVKK